MSVTIAQSFRVVRENALPLYDNPSPMANASASGESTTNTDPSQFSTNIPSERWIQMGIDYLTLLVNLLGSEYLSRREEAMYHANEGDVVRAAALYLLHPINQALCAYPDLVGRVKCQSEYTSNKIRSDITFYRSPRGANEPKKQFAVVEFKKRGVIKRHEFLAAERDLQRTSAQVHLQAAFGAAGNSGGRRGQTGENTFFKGDALVPIKQAGAYALKHRTRYVALFNWDFLLLVKFCRQDYHETDEAALFDKGVGEWCETTTIPYANESHTMRAALLGFLVEGYQSTPN